MTARSDGSEPERQKVQQEGGQEECRRKEHRGREGLMETMQPDSFDEQPRASSSRRRKNNADMKRTPLDKEFLWKRITG